MVKPLSEQLAALSAQAKDVEDAATAARTETAAQIEARRESTREAAATAIDQVDQTLTGIEDAIAGHWADLRAKVAEHLDLTKATITDRKHEMDVTRLTARADAADREASMAIAFALAAVENAKLAVLDAIAARRQADDVRNA